MTEYPDRWADAARACCTAYLNGTAAYGDHRHWQEYDNLPPEGQVVWRAVVAKAVEIFGPTREAELRDAVSELNRVRAAMVELDNKFESVSREFVDAVGYEPLAIADSQTS